MNFQKISCGPPFQRVLCGPPFAFDENFQNMFLSGFRQLSENLYFHQNNDFQVIKTWYENFEIFLSNPMVPSLAPRVIFQKFKLWLKMLSKLSNYLVKTMI
jgi:hypothetical protein